MPRSFVRTKTPSPASPRSRRRRRNSDSSIQSFGPISRTSNSIRRQEREVGTTAVGPLQELIFCFDYQQPRGCRWPLCKYIHCRPEEECIYRENGLLTDTIREQVIKGIGLIQPICKDYLNNCCNRVQCRFRHQRPVQRENDEQTAELLNLRKELECLKREVGDLRLTNSLLLQINSDLRVRLASNQLGAAATSLPLTLCAASNVLTTRNRQYILPVSANQTRNDTMGGILSCALSSFPQIIGRYTEPHLSSPLSSHYTHLHPNDTLQPTVVHTDTIPSFSLQLPSNLNPFSIDGAHLQNPSFLHHSLSPPSPRTGIPVVASSAISSAVWATLMAAAVTSPPAMTGFQFVNAASQRPSSDISIVSSGFYESINGNIEEQQQRTSGN